MVSNNLSLISKTLDLLPNKYEQIPLIRDFNPFVSNAPFLYPLKTSENRKVFRCLQEVEKGCIGNEWVNTEKCDRPMDDFCNIYNLCSLIKVLTCYKNRIKPTCIGLILINSLKCFLLCVIETGLSDFYKMTITIKTTFRKHKPKRIRYSDYKTFSNNAFEKTYY